MAGMSKAQQVESWNYEHPIGSKVVVTRDNGETLETTVKHEAQLLGGHSPVAWVHGISGCYDIGRITSYGGLQANAEGLSDEDLNGAAQAMQDERNALLLR